MATKTQNENQLVPYTYKDAKRALDDLLAEQGSLPARMQAAADAGDWQALAGLEQRGDILPRLIHAARLRVVKARIADLQAAVPVAKEAFAVASAAHEKAHALWAEQQATYAEARAAFYAAHESQAQAQIELKQARLELADLQNATLLAAPVIRNTGWTRQTGGGGGGSE